MSVSAHEMLAFTLGVGGAQLFGVVGWQGGSVEGREKCVGRRKGNSVRLILVYGREGGRGG